MTSPMKSSNMDTGHEEYTRFSTSKLLAFDIYNLCSVQWKCAPEDNIFPYTILRSPLNILNHLGHKQLATMAFRVSSLALFNASFAFRKYELARSTGNLNAGPSRLWNCNYKPPQDDIFWEGKISYGLNFLCDLKLLRNGKSHALRFRYCASPRHNCVWGCMVLSDTSRRVACNV